MHNHSKHNCKILKYGVNDPGLAFAGKVGLGPFWTWVKVLSYVHVLQLLVGTSLSSFRHERMSTGGKFLTRFAAKERNGAAPERGLGGAGRHRSLDCWLQRARGRSK
jgi:hypothetical protein